MASELHHARSSVRRWGGQLEDYLPIHSWFDQSKESFADPRHRALRHHAEGIALMETIFRLALDLHDADGAIVKTIPTRWVGEQHVLEDLGRIPTAADWLREIRPQTWMNAPARGFDPGDAS